MRTQPRTISSLGFVQMRKCMPSDTALQCGAIWQALYASWQIRVSGILSKNRHASRVRMSAYLEHFPRRLASSRRRRRARRVQTLWSGTIKYLRSEAMWNCVSQLSNLIQFSLFSLKSVPKHHRMSKTSKLCVAPLHGVFKKILEKDKHIESYKL
ncbi:Hypothetical_protein [Hexamita inflata]|uniref:Hypothetical_protein n=1 Tax=Hexamita inflata TaxID=28002 RepID=A0AA86R4F7_9EUKA|nr:Hypothetical protein HINF_LOCUS49720 [Hexamita inflata]